MGQQGGYCLVFAEVLLTTDADDCVAFDADGSVDD